MHASFPPTAKNMVPVPLTVRPHSEENQRGMIKSRHDYEPLDKDYEKSRCGSCCRKICRCIRCQLCIIFLIGICVGSISLYAGIKFVQAPARQNDTLFSCTSTNDTEAAASMRQATQACKDRHGDLWTPANLTQSIDFPDCMIGTLFEKMAEFNSEHDWKLVSFPSRQGKSGQQKVNLKAWWLPLQKPNAPRIVVVHGNNGNFNDFSVQVVAYLLRSIGFAVLVPNLRDHGISDSSAHRSVGWGWDYYLDVLGAWDYAVRDPYGILGAKMLESSVGIMGFGMGAFATSIALGQERLIPAVWLDSAVFRPREILRSQLSRIVGPLAPAFTGIAWETANTIAGVNLSHATPESALLSQLQQKKRFIAISHNRMDTRVPFNQAEEFLAMFARLPSYRIEETYFPHAAGCGSDGHGILPLWRPDRYRRHLCEFWSGVFGRFATECRLDDLPKFDNALDYASARQAQDRRLADSTKGVLIAT